MVEDGGLPLREEESEEVIEGKSRLAVVGMGLIGGNQVKASRKNLHIPLAKMQHGTPALDAEKAQKGRGNVAALPAMTRAGVAQIQDYKVFHTWDDGKK